MKSAKERAAEVWKALPSSAQVAVDLNYLRDERGLTGMRAWLRDVRVAFEEYAREQRCVCSDAANAVDYSHGSFTEFQSRVTSAVLRAPAPGEEQ